MKFVFGIFLICLFLIFCSCDDNHPFESIDPEYQSAIYVMDSDGSNKEKIIDGGSNVQYIPNTNKILYVKGGYEADTLYTVNDDGSENSRICGELKRFFPSIKISEDGQYCYVVSFMYGDRTSDIYQIDLINKTYINLTNNNNKRVYTNAYKENILVYTVEESQDNWLLMKLDLNNNQFDTLLTVQENTFINPITFGNTNNEIIFSWAGVDFLCGIYNMDIAENVVDTITTLTYGGGLTFTNYNNLFIEHNDILHFDLSTNILTSLVLGEYPDFHSDIMLYSTGSHDYNSDIRALNLLNMENILLTSHGFNPSFSNDAEKIVFIGIEEISYED